MHLVLRLPVFCLLVSLAGSVVAAQAPRQTPPLTTPQPAVVSSPPAAAAGQPAPQGLQDRRELEAFLDGVIAAQKDANHVEGVAVAVVKDGELFFAKGYGFADRAAGKMVNPERTLFRVGSVSKLFTWTSVMQLVEQGKLDLQADVNKYLAGSPVHVPDTYARPVTLTNLLTHTPGFEDVVIGLFRRSPQEVRPLGDVLAAEMPLRVRPPGQLSSYSNHGTALAGYIVERVSGVPFEQYVEKQILEPLQMAHTTVRQPLPPQLAADMAAGYRFRRGEHQPQPFEYVPLSAAGAVSASAVDMSHFMLAHLQDGAYGQSRILSEATARRMRERLFAHSATLNGMLHGFIQMDRNGRRIYGHGGDTLWFHTVLALLPDEKVGIFVSHNTDTGAPAAGALVEAFVDRYFPDGAAATSIAGTRREPAGTFSGSYRTVRRSYRSLAAVAGLMGTVSVSELPDGRIETSAIAGGGRRWVEVAPMTFRDAEGTDRIAFLKGPDGKATHLVPDFPAVAMERVAGLETAMAQFLVGGASLLLLASAVIAFPIIAWNARGRRRFPFVGSAVAVGAARRDPPPRWGRLVLWCASVLLILFVVLLAASLADPMQIVFGLPTMLLVALALPIAAVVLTLAALVFAARAWRGRYWGLFGRIYYTAATAAAMVLLAMLNYWKLLGYHLQ